MEATRSLLICPKHTNLLWPSKHRLQKLMQAFVRISESLPVEVAFLAFAAVLQLESKADHIDDV